MVIVAGLIGLTHQKPTDARPPTEFQAFFAQTLVGDMFGLTCAWIETRSALLSIPASIPQKKLAGNLIEIIRIFGMGDGEFYQAFQKWGEVVGRARL